MNDMIVCNNQDNQMYQSVIFILTFSSVDNIINFIPFMIMDKPRWWNWQTRYFEGVVRDSSCGFESRSRHQKNGFHLADDVRFVLYTILLRSLAQFAVIYY